MGKIVLNQKQAISHSLREHRNCVSDVQSESDTTQEENNRFLDHTQMMQKENIDITGEISNIVANHTHTEEEIIKLNTMASENIESIDDIKKKNDKSMTEKADIESKLNRFFWINKKALNEFENISGQEASLHIKIKGLNNSNH